MIPLKTLLLAITVISNFSNCTTNYVQSIEITDGSTTIIDTLWTKKIEKSNSYWKENLTAKQYYIAREKGTERSFTSPYNNYKKDGIYICVACNNPLFSSTTKFKSGTGWPSFWAPYFSKSVTVGVDNTLGLTRDELLCGRCNAHIGHVFNDGPKPTSLRYCINGESLNFIQEQNLEKVVFAQGCFWCMEEIFESIKGVNDVVSGYSGGSQKNPTYEKVGSGSTSHAESIEVTYNPATISYEKLLKVYFNSGNITQVNGQGNDRGTQYRSIVFYTSKEQKKQIENYIQKLENSGLYSKKIAVEVLPFEKFYAAEQYHQNYVKLHPNQGYVRAVSIPRHQKAIKNFPELLK